jgi:hypothetical protein
MEKSQKRVASPPVVVCQAQGPSLADLNRFEEHRRKLFETAKQLDPTKPNSMDAFRTASDCIKLMAQIYLKNRGAPTVIDAQSG